MDSYEAMVSEAVRGHPPREGKSTLHSFGREISVVACLMEEDSETQLCIKRQRRIPSTKQTITLGQFASKRQ